MDLLKRSLAPLLPEAWEAIDAEAKRVLELNLAGRKVVDFQGPYGLAFAAVNTGRLEPLVTAEKDGLSLGLRKVQPLVELRVPIVLSMSDLDALARGASDPDLEPVVRAAERMARAEDTAIFDGLAGAAIAGIRAASPHKTQGVPRDVRGLPEAVVAAKDTLRHAGVSGPYALVLGPKLHDQVLAATDEGYPLSKRLDQILNRPIIRAEAIEGGALLSVRGGDYVLTVGQDLSIGYVHHTRAEVELVLLESFTFRVLEPTAAVRLG